MDFGSKEIYEARINELFKNNLNDIKKHECPQPAFKFDYPKLRDIYIRMKKGEDVTENEKSDLEDFAIYNEYSERIHARNIANLRAYLGFYVYLRDKQAMKHAEKLKSKIFCEFGHFETNILRGQTEMEACKVLGS